MKIAYLLPCCTVSGGVAVVMQHANRLHARGHEVILVNQQQDTDTNWFPRQLVPVISVELYPSDVDILVATAWSTSFQVARMSAKRKFYFVQSDETRFHPPESIWQHFTTLSYCLDFQYITEARWIQTWLLDNFGQQAKLVPNGLDPALFYPCTPLEPKGQRRRVLLEGAIGLPYKGMAEAFAAILPLDVEVWCVSSFGKPQPGWKCHRFFEQVPMDRMREIYSSCDILLKLSKVEGFFGPPMEMMACGGVSVVCRVTGHDEYIVDGFNALVTDTGDIPAATAAVRRLIEDCDLYAELQANGRETAQKWLWESSINELEKIYSAALDSPLIARRPYSTDINGSIATLYAASLGEITFGSEAMNNQAVTSNVDRFCRWLKGKRWFVRLADMVITVHMRLKSLRLRYQSGL